MKKAIVILLMAGAVLFGSVAFAVEDSVVSAVGADTFVVVTENGRRIDLYQIRNGKIMFLDATIMQREDVRRPELHDYVIRNIKVEHKPEFPPEYH
jgi:hypothetical protein